MGGGLTFLNKKPWHPGSLQNIEIVSKRENEAHIREKKLQERELELKKERECEDLLRFDDKKGVMTLRDASLDWMYGGGLSPKLNADSRVHSNTHDSLKVDVKSGLEDQHQLCAERTSRTSFPLSGTFLMSNGEMWNRIVNDPVVNIKRYEQMQRQSVWENPTIMSQLTEEMTHFKSVCSKSDSILLEGKKKKNNTERTEAVRPLCHGSDIGCITRQTKNCSENSSYKKDGLNKITDPSYNEILRNPLNSDKKNFRHTYIHLSNTLRGREKIKGNHSQKTNLGDRIHALRHYVRYQKRNHGYSEKQKWAITEMIKNSEKLNYSRTKTKDKDVKTEENPLIKSKINMSNNDFDFMKNISSTIVANQSIADRIESRIHYLKKSL